MAVPVLLAPVSPNSPHLNFSTPAAGETKPWFVSSVAVSSLETENGLWHCWAARRSGESCGGEVQQCRVLPLQVGSAAPALPLPPSLLPLAKLGLAKWASYGGLVLGGVWPTSTAKCPPKIHLEQAELPQGVARWQPAFL